MKLKKRISIILTAALFVTSISFNSMAETAELYDAVEIEEAVELEEIAEEIEETVIEEADVYKSTTADKTSEVKQLGVGEASGVAKVGETTYETLKAAVENATNETVELLDDVVLDEKITINNSLTIDGNGYTISGQTANSNVYFDITGGSVSFKNLTLDNFAPEAISESGKAIIKVESSASGEPDITIDNVNFKKFARAAIDVRKGKIEIKNSSIDCSSTAANALTKGILVGLGEIKVMATVSNVTIKDANSKSADWSSSGIEVYNNAETVIDNVTIENCKNAIWVDNYWGSGDVDVTINDSTIESVASGSTAVRIYGGNGKKSSEYTDKANVDILGGTYNGRIAIVNVDENDTNNTIEVYDGTFNGTLDVEGNTAELASVANGTFNSITWMSAIKGTGTITMAKDETIKEPANVYGEVKLDLNGKELAAADDFTDTARKTGVIIIHRGGDLTVDDTSKEGDGKILSNGKVYAAVVLTHSGDSGDAAAKLIVNGGELCGWYYGIAGNGSRHGTEITINDGIICSTDGLGLYHPQDGKITINGGTFTGCEAAIELRAGNLLINGGSFTSTIGEFEYQSNGSGTTVEGAAIAISPHSTGKNIYATISNGLFKGIYGLFSVNTQPSKIADIKLAITGGTFIASASEGYAASSADADVKNFISGGWFSTEPAKKDVAEGYETICIAEKEVPYTVVKTESEKKEEDKYGKVDLNPVIVGDPIESVDGLDKALSDTDALKLIGDNTDDGNILNIVLYKSFIDKADTDKPEINKLFEEAQGDGDKLLEFFDLSMEAILKDNEGVVLASAPISETDQFQKIIIKIPEVVRQSENETLKPTLYKYHGGVIIELPLVETLEDLEKASKECWFNSGENAVIKANKFSVYAFGIGTPEPFVPDEPAPINNGPSGSSGTKAKFFTGEYGNPVTGGTWKYEPSTDTWTFSTSRMFVSTWGYIANPYATGTQHNADWFYFNETGKMMTGWQWIKGYDGVIRCYFLNPLKDNTLGACLIGPAVTPDGYTVDENGAWTVNGTVVTKEAYDAEQAAKALAQAASLAPAVPVAPVVKLTPPATQTAQGGATPYSAPVIG